MHVSISSTGPGDSWAQFYQHNDSGQALAPSGRTTATMFTDRASDTSVVTTAFSSSSAPNPHGSSTTNPSAAGHLNPKGRVSKPIRRQSRASRRTPTTLLNTDPTNFRAMVQQFTGGATVHTGSHPSGPANSNFEVGIHPQIVNPTAVMVPSGAYYHDLQFHHQQQQQQQHQQQQQYRHQQIMFPVNSRTTNQGYGDSFLQRLANSRPTMEMDRGFASAAFIDPMKNRTN